MLKKICVIGLGYVGLPTAVILASKGGDVVGCDTNPEVVSEINQGKKVFHEADLDSCLAKVVQMGSLVASVTPVKADVYIIAVPTPILRDKSPDMACVLRAFTTFASYVAKGNLIILESTSPIGTTKMLAEHLEGLRPDLDFTSNSPDVLMAYCPERILPGNALVELTNNPRCIGGLTKEAGVAAKSIYNVFCNGELIITTAETAELSKLVENSFRDVNIAFANEVSLICDEHNINSQELISIANKHPRVSILNPGIGVGGHCIPVDPWFIVHSNPNEAKIIKQARLVNDYKPKYLAKKIIALAKTMNITRLGILGLTYKPDADDFRDAPSFSLISELITEPSLTIFIHDPFMPYYSGRLQKGVVVVEMPQTLINEVDIVLVSTCHSCYGELSFEEHLKNGTLVDPSGFVQTCQQLNNDLKSLMNEKSNLVS